mmetsp:Transcript_22980/g.63746  ORF Transcript_22980/g.63746 Transcript_22980/m.63746 type:complete len:398 (+) Transcript_22980:90-1283(+)|eukprot:CAMPEP_0172379506 /NCGR_PEP_ID=MMETSP1060-20121228/69968_1 /TAXON_ID=37318 /ORGANISM="Pseudo-nitzschia pungens, Strain cf. cingulata" /LENGTH=397 /DNA_ID=CAMNT_0013107247 /DNA_START=79 /DNA_END=1272 /DNA_ORIENTATION=-
MGEHIPTPGRSAPVVVGSDHLESEGSNEAKTSSVQHDVKLSETPSSSFPPISEEQQWQQQKQKQKQKQQKQNRSKRHGARNQHRHKFFVKWLLETFDLDESRTKTPITKTAATTCGGTKSTREQGSTGTKDETIDDENAIGSEDRVIDGQNSALVSDDDETSSPSSTTSSSRPQRQMHVLDVAGGKGEVSARLTMCHQQQVIMVDPRPADIVDCYERIVLPKIPNKWQRRLEKQREANPDFVKDIVEARFQQLVTTFDEDKVIPDATCHSIGATDSPPSSSSASKESESESPTELQSAVQNATLIVGLHADGATEAIVDAALEYDKPFVVVPCCVFPNFFPNRRILVDDPGDGSPPKTIRVRTHEQFCTYLLRKDPRFVMEELPFEGRNIAIWWNGK